MQNNLFYNFRRNNLDLQPRAENIWEANNFAQRAVRITLSITNDDEIKCLNRDLFLPILIYLEFHII